ncbi:MAG: helicase-related protein [Acidiferrobacterales bacterium]|nr:helicase-related protein [Acidiferrobacterales bacterium]
MARVNKIDRAIAIHKLYEKNLHEFNPVIVHSRMSGSERTNAIAMLQSRNSRIIVCVDMLGEGFDLPQLKISGLHDRHKSVAITLQFTGRFTRDCGNIGDATVIANIEQSDIDDALRSLYAEDADWNYLLKILSEKKTTRQLKRAEVLEGFNESLEGIPLQTLNPKMSTVVYRTNCAEWRPQNIDEIMPIASVYSGPVINEAERLAVFVTRDQTNVKWSSTKEVVNVEWNLYLVHWDRNTNLLYINSTKKNDLHEKLAKAICGDCAIRIHGENVYRILDGINRLMLANLGLSHPLGRYIRYTMFVGSDITTQLNAASYSMKRKSNLFGLGYRGDGKVTVGCSAKGKIWSMQSAGDFSEWLDWCRLMGSKLIDESITTNSFIHNLIQQEVITERPAKPPIAVHWPESLLVEFEERIKFRFGSGEWVGFHNCEIDVAHHNESLPIRFTVSTETATATFEVRLSEGGAEYPQIDGPPVLIDYKEEQPVSELFKNDAPHIHFADGDFLIFNELFKLPQREDRIVFDLNKIETRDWSGTDLNSESQGQGKNPRSIQRAVIEELLALEPRIDVVFDDDGSGEIADVVAVSEKGEQLKVELFHCKYAHGAAPGNRVSDLYEVCGQSQKSVRWRENPGRVLKRMVKRENDRLTAGQVSRFERGNLGILKSLVSRWHELELDYRVWIVQPGLSKTKIEPKQLDLLAATEIYLLETYRIPLRVIASK